MIVEGVPMPRNPNKTPSAIPGSRASTPPLALDAQDDARFADLAFQGAGTVSCLVRARKTLPGDTGVLLGFLARAAEQPEANMGEAS
jgi:hypothetical protein